MKFLFRILILSVVCFYSSEVYSQEDITLSVPEINYGSVASQLMSALVPVVLTAIGIGLSIWVLWICSLRFRGISLGAERGIPISEWEHEEEMGRNNRKRRRRGRRGGRNRRRNK